MSNIKNIIFDLGGVFIEIDYHKTEKAFINLGVSNFTELYNQHHASHLFENLETGKITSSEFYHQFRLISKTNLTDKQIEIAWNAMLGNFYEEHLRWLVLLKNEYKLFLFSNTNIIHYQAFQKVFHQQTGKQNFDDYFIKAYYSHVLGHRKPYPESFKSLLQMEQLNPGETLFIDDTLKNIEGAKKAGLHTIYLPKALNLIKTVNDYIASPVK